MKEMWTARVSAVVRTVGNADLSPTATCPNMPLLQFGDPANLRGDGSGQRRLRQSGRPP